MPAATARSLASSALLSQYAGSRVTLPSSDLPKASSYAAMSRSRHHPPGQGFTNWFDCMYVGPPSGSFSVVTSWNTGEARLQLAASVRMPITWCRQGTLRFPPFHQLSYDTPQAMPVSPSRVMSMTARVPIRFTPATIAGSRFGLSGSRYGGVKNRSSLLPCWWTSHKTCGYHSRYIRPVSSRVSAWVSMNQSRLLSCPV